MQNTYINIIQKMHKLAKLWIILSIAGSIIALEDNIFKN